VAFQSTNERLEDRRLNLAQQACFPVERQSRTSRKARKMADGESNEAETDEAIRADAVRAWAERVKRRQTMADWQPIETAPKDGTFVLVGAWCDVGFDKEDLEFVQTVAFCNPHVENDWLCANDEHDVQPLPTHWMPLPTPPETDNGRR
jgi:hypothetical protein